MLTPVRLCSTPSSRAIKEQLCQFDVLLGRRSGNGRCAVPFSGHNSGVRVLPGCQQRRQRQRQLLRGTMALYSPGRTQPDGKARRQRCCGHDSARGMGAMAWWAAHPAAQAIRACTARCRGRQPYLRGHALRMPLRSVPWRPHGSALQRATLHTLSTRPVSGTRTCPELACTLFAAVARCHGPSTQQLGTKPGPGPGQWMRPGGILVQVWPSS